MNPEHIPILSEAIFWILLIISSPYIGRVVYSLSLPLWAKAFRSEYIEITVCKDNKQLKVIVRRDDDYLDELDDAMERAGMK